MPTMDASFSQRTSIWMGDLEPWMSEEYLKSMWNSIGEDVQIKLIKNKYSVNSNYCFVDFQSPQSSQRALSMLNGTLMPNSNRPFRLNWASGVGAQEARTEDRPHEFPVFVGDLGSEVDDALLLSVFKPLYLSVSSAKIIVDPNTGMSRGYGFVHFLDEMEQQRALVEMQGHLCGSRPMRISVATQRTKSQIGGAKGFGDPNSNTTVFVGGLGAETTEDVLCSQFGSFGEIVHVKIPAGKGCGFITFQQRQSAEFAISKMNGFLFNGSRLRVNWGRAQNKYGADKRGGYAAGNQGFDPAYYGGGNSMNYSPHEQHQGNYGYTQPTETLPDH